MKTRLDLHRSAFCVLTLILLAHTGCSAVPRLGHSTACDALPASCDGSGQLACVDTLACADTACDSMPCDCDGGCDVCREDPSCDACDAYPGLTSRQLVRGRRIKLLDEAGSILGFANKIALWDMRADSHQISPGTEREVLEYLRRNRLNSTLVRSNQYDPLGEFGRLVANKRMAAPWKYTFGTYDWLKYTLIPGRLLGGDWYNPFTDTVHLYSDIPSIGLAKAAYAKDVHSRTLPGTYAASQDTPLIGLWHESLANEEVIRYLQRTGSGSDVESAKRILYPDFAGSLGAQVLGFLPYGNVYGRAAGALTGHAYREITESETVRQATGGSSLFR